MNKVISAFLSFVLVLFATCATPSIAKNAASGGTVKTSGAVDGEIQSIKSYTKKDGTVVKGYERKKTSKADAAPADDTHQVKGYA
jgi:hypothetical protein